jgi:predicted Zn-dependent protease/predicted negative regulator of RcsB-dependent stress response
MKNGIAALVMLMLVTAPLQAGASTPKASSQTGRVKSIASKPVDSQEVALKKAIEAASKNSPMGVAKGFFDLGGYYSASGQLELAKAAYSQGISYASQHLPTNHPMTGLLMCQLSTVYMKQQDFNSALTLLSQGVSILDQSPSMAETAFKLRGVRDMLASFNDGVQSMKMYNYTQAETDFKTAVDVGEELQEPNIISVSYSSMGWARMMQDQYEAAEGDIQKALVYADAGHTVDAKLLALIAYGSLKSRQGDINGAKDYFQQALAGSDVDFQRIKINRSLFQQEVDRLDMVQSELDKTVVSAQDVDYYQDSMLTHKVFHWNNQNGVIKVYLAPGEGIPGWTPAYAERFKEACQRWQTVLGNQVRFEFTDDPNAKVDTHVTWNGGYDKRSGLTRYRYISDKLVMADIDINLKNYDGHFYDPQTVYRLSLHEVGHLLGIAGHSRNPKDIMYPSISVANDLSPRDIATMRKLYQHAPEISNPNGMTLAEYRDTPEYQVLKAKEEPASPF